MKSESIIIILAIIIFITFYIIALVFKNKPISDFIITGGIGSIFAGTFFGIMKDSITGEKNNPAINIYIIIFFFIWYVLTKFLGNIIKNKSVEYATEIKIPANENENEIEDTDVVVKEKEVSKSIKNWKEGLSKSLISFIIIFIIVILGISFYKEETKIIIYLYIMFL